MELTVGKKYRVTDQQGNCFVMVAVNSHRLEIASGYLVGLSDIKGFIIAPEVHSLGDLTITLIDDEPATGITLEEALVSRSREVALLELLQAITAGVYCRQPYGQSDFDPDQALLHIRTRLAAFDKSPQQ